MAVLPSHPAPLALMVALRGLADVPPQYLKAEVTRLWWDNWSLAITSGIHGNVERVMSQEAGKTHPVGFQLRVSSLLVHRMRTS